MNDLNKKNELNNKELAIVNHLKLQRYEPKDDPPTIVLLSDEEISIATKIKDIPYVRKVLAGLQAKGVVAQDKYGNWCLSARLPAPADPSQQKPQLINLKIKLIRLDGGTQIREKINQRLVEEYAEDIRGGATFPPIVVFLDSEGKYYLADGFHRVLAAVVADKEEIQSQVYRGSLRDAILFSCGANAKHGLRRSNKDKRNSVLTLLTDENWQQWSDREIARRTGTSNTFVTNLRKNLTVNVYSENQQDNTDELAENQQRTYKNKHGQVATMNTANIGKTPLGELVEAARVKVKEGYGVRSGQIGTISYFPNNSNALVAFGDDRTELIPKNQLEVVDEGVGDRALGVGKSPEPTPDRPQPEINNVDRELADKQEELGLGRGGNSALPPSDRLDYMQHSNPTDVDDRPFANPIITEVNPNAVLSSFINGLQFLGNEQIEVATRAIAKRKKEAVSKAAYGLADSEDEAVEIIKAIASKYPNAINLAIEF